ncbi:hypothetical protein CFP71_13335 [Amycolatopsis thailandensis]|uniref:Uncharacterized protein n=1 Tax=Amycolatopsis thailandensis TaxID=589330 RepID=A0A229SBW9_9PSEU|nr:hypothetical protein [Amycolatopsis thailandensis]OXM56406.1 hypothetical protein CFP71_13335 [Amycolatopsis thailandensis]
MTATGVREALAVLPSWRWAGFYVLAYLTTSLLRLTAKASGPMIGTAIGYAVAGPIGAVVGLLIGQATHTGPTLTHIASLLDDGADRLGQAANRITASVADEIARQRDESAKRAADRYAGVCI